MSNSTDRRIPSLDGFRAISILMVCYGHLSGTRNFPVSIVEYGRWCGDVAHLGVLVFFVISGFLITSLLMSEHEMTDAVSLKRFYLRRIVRIFPAFYAFILVMAVATLLGAAQLTGRDFAYALTYTVNFEPNRALQIGHLWSLSVEEQFYLLWPLTLLLLRERRALFVAVAAICATKPRTIHGQNTKGGIGSADSVATHTPIRNITAKGKPNRKRTCVAPTVPSVAVSSRCMALRAVCAAAAMMVKTAQSISYSAVMRGHSRP